MVNQHPTSAIIATAEFVPRVLDLIYKSEANEAHIVVIVVGEVSHQMTAGVASNIRLLRFSDIERNGYRADRVLTSPPRMFIIYTPEYDPTSFLRRCRCFFSVIS